MAITPSPVSSGSAPFARHNVSAAYSMSETGHKFRTQVRGFDLFCWRTIVRRLCAVIIIVVAAPAVAAGNTD